MNGGSARAPYGPDGASSSSSPCYTLICGGEKTDEEGGTKPQKPKEDISLLESCSLPMCCASFCLIMWALILITLVICKIPALSPEAWGSDVNDKSAIKKIFTRSDVTPAQQEIELNRLRKELVNRSTVNKALLQKNELFDKCGGIEFGSANASRMPKLMYQATPIGHNVPQKLRGVFWMRGNSGGEELMVLHHGHWEQEEGLYIMPIAPFMWAWPNSKPKGAAHDGPMYNRNNTQIGALRLIGDGQKSATFSYKFDKPTNFDTDLQSASLQAHLEGNTRKNAISYLNLFPYPFGFMSKYFAGQFTLEEQKAPGKEAGSLWNRRCTWGFGRFGPRPFEMGSYELVKIIDGAGSKIEPEHTEFVNYMGNVSLFVWDDVKSADKDVETPNKRMLHEVV